jgi:hypothetical protein
VGDERWTVRLASWMMAFGCLPYSHIHMGLKAERGVRPSQALRG